MKEKGAIIGLVTFPISGAGVIPLSNLVDIFYTLSGKIHLIVGGTGYTFFMKNKKVHLYQIEHRAGTNAVITRAMNYIWTQLRISYRLMRLTSKVDLWVFFIGAEGLVLPLLTAKLLKKNIVIVSAGCGFKVAQAQKDPFARVLALSQNITYCLADRIIMYSERLIEGHSSHKYRNNIFIACKHFLDFDRFRIEKGFDERKNLVGYIGALSEVKGILSLLKAIPKVLEKREDIEFIIGGEGQLRSEIEEHLGKKNLISKVKLLGWIPHDEVPEYLNELRLIILPSYTEGLPNIILEAMACGAPVLATAVGAIPDIIRDGVTGFIMEDNSPECIATNIIRALNYSKLEGITKNARALVEKKYSFKGAVERYREIFKVPFFLL